MVCIQFSIHFTTMFQVFRMSPGLALYASKKIKFIQHSNQKISTEIIDPATLDAYTAWRLIPLDKSPGDTQLQVRPIGVGEVVRRIVGKTISWCLNDDSQKAAGSLQVSTGLKGGAEVAIHSMKTHSIGWIDL